MIEYNESKKRVFNNDGTITLEILKQYKFKLSDFVIDELPKTCNDCPYGFMANNDHIPCGRRIPLDSTCRSPDCKLQTIDEVLEGEGGE